MSDFKFKRHGDVLITEANLNTSDMEVRVYDAQAEGLALALGEASGHVHSVRAFEGGVVEEFVPKGGTSNTQSDEIFFRIKGADGVVIHQEHEPIRLKEGVVYRRVIQQEYNPWTQQMKRVID